MISPVTPPSTSPGSPNQTQAPQALPTPAHRLSFSVASLLADTKKSSDTSSRLSTSSTSPRSSPVNSYSPTHHISSPLSKYTSTDLRSPRYGITESLKDYSDPRIPHYTSCDSPKSIPDHGTSSKNFDLPEFTAGSPTHRHFSGLLDYRMSSSPVSTDLKTPDSRITLSPKHHSIIGARDFRSQSPRSSHDEGRSRCSEGEDVEDVADDESSLVDVEDLQQHTSSPSPVRPTPAYIGGFSALGNISGITPGLHPAIWGGHQSAAAAAAATFFPSHFSHHAPLNGKLPCHYFDERLCKYLDELLNGKRFLDINLVKGKLIWDCKKDQRTSSRRKCSHIAKFTYNILFQATTILTILSQLCPV